MGYLQKDSTQPPRFSFDSSRVVQSRRPQMVYTLHEAPTKTNWGPVYSYLPGATLVGDVAVRGRLLVMFASLGKFGAPVYRMEEAKTVYTDSMDAPGEFLGYHYDGCIEPYKRKA